MAGTGPKALNDILAFPIPAAAEMASGIQDIAVEEDQAIIGDYTPVFFAILFDLPRPPELPFYASQHGQRDAGAETRQRWRANQGQTMIVCEANDFESATVATLHSHALCAQVGDEVPCANGVLRMQIKIFHSQTDGQGRVTQTAKAAGGPVFFKLANDGHQAMSSDAASSTASSRMSSPPRARWPARTTTLNRATFFAWMASS